jgi:pimeloyl-[acyl-carrier protein] methyl ester esterase
LNRPRGIAIAGWGHEFPALRPLAAGLEGVCDCAAFSCADLASTGAQRDSLSAYAAGLMEEVRRCSGRVLLVGWSMGGIVAMEAALASPENVLGLVLIGSTARFCADGSYACGVDGRVLRTMLQAAKRDPRSTLRGFLERAAAPVQFDAAELESLTEEGLAAGAPELLRQLEYLQQIDLRARLPALKLPVLLIHGMRDAIIPWQASAYLAEQVRGSRAVLLPGRGHDLPVRDPALVAAEALNFMEAVCSRETHI